MDLKIATVKRHYMGGATDDCYLIENVADLAAYSHLRNLHVEKALVHTLRSPLPIEKFDHDIPSNTPMAGMMVLAWHRARTAQEGVLLHGNPFFQIEGAAMAGLNAIGRAVGRGETVLVNVNGGWCTVVPSMMEVLSVRHGSLEEALPPIKIPSGATWMALENDTRLSPAALEYITPKDKNFALVTSLRQRYFGEVTDAIKEFAGLGGVVVFAETTGIDERQLRSIGSGLPKLGVRQAVVVVTGGITPEIRAIQAEAEAAGLTVRLLDGYSAATRIGRAAESRSVAKRRTGAKRTPAKPGASSSKRSPK